jgi:hypothetical protein
MNGVFYHFGIKEYFYSLLSTSDALLMKNLFIQSESSTHLLFSLPDAKFLPAKIAKVERSTRFKVTFSS